MNDTYNEKHPLKVNKFWVNPDYINKLKTYCTHTVETKSREHSAGINHYEVSLDIVVRFQSKSDNILVMDSEFNQFYEVVLSYDDNEQVRSMDKMLFEHRVFETFGQVLFYLQKHTHPNIFEISPPLIAAGDKSHLANDIFEKLLKYPA